MPGALATPAVRVAACLLAAAAGATIKGSDYPKGKCCLCPHDRNKNNRYWGMGDQAVAPENIHFSGKGTCNRCLTAPKAVIPWGKCDRNPRKHEKCHNKCVELFDDQTKSFEAQGQFREVTTAEREVTISWEQASIFEAGDFATLSIKEPNGLIENLELRADYGLCARTDWLIGIGDRYFRDLYHRPSLVRETTQGMPKDLDRLRKTKEAACTLARSLWRFFKDRQQDLESVKQLPQCCVCQWKGLSSPGDNPNVYYSDSGRCTMCVAEEMPGAGFERVAPFYTVPYKCSGTSTGCAGFLTWGDKEKHNACASIVTAAMLSSVSVDRVKVQEVQQNAHTSMKVEAIQKFDGKIRVMFGDAEPSCDKACPLTNDRWHSPNFGFSDAEVQIAGRIFPKYSQFFPGGLPQPTAEGICKAISRLCVWKKTLLGGCGKTADQDLLDRWPVLKVRS